MIRCYQLTPFGGLLIVVYNGLRIFPTLSRSHFLTAALKSFKRGARPGKSVLNYKKRLGGPFWKELLVIYIIKICISDLNSTGKPYEFIRC